MSRRCIAISLALSAFFAIGGLCGEGQPSRRALPGVQPGGAILLPNQWSIRPAGKQLELGDFPVNLALHRAESGWPRFTRAMASMKS